MVWSLGFGVLEFRSWSLEFRACGLEFRVWGLYGFMQGAGFGV